MSDKSKLVYICSPYAAGDVQENVEKAKEYCKLALREGFIPVAPHLLYPQFLCDEDEAEREHGLSCGLALLAVCSEVWVFGNWQKSEGMRREVEYAGRRKIPVMAFDEFRPKAQENTMLLRLKYLRSYLGHAERTNERYGTDYIKREDAIMAAMDYNGCGNAQDASQDIAAEIASIPASDVRENVRGRWVVDEKENPNGVDWCHFSVCGCKDITQNISSIYFCPNCGAAMRGKKDG